MKLPEMSGKNFARLKFISFFSAAVLLCVIILSSFWGPIPSKPPQELKSLSMDDLPETQRLLMIDQMLHSKWMELEQLYGENTLSLADPSKISNAARKQLRDAEISYAKVLDSISTSNYNITGVEKIDSTVNSFRAALQNRQALNNNISEIALRNIGKSANLTIDTRKTEDQQLSTLRDDLVAKNNTIAKLQTDISAAAEIKNKFSVNEQKLLQLQNDLQSKTAMIATLQGQAEAASSKNTGAASSQQKVRQLENEVKAKNDMIAKLQAQVLSISTRVSNAGTVDEKKLAELQKALQSKTAMISKLQSQVNSLPVKTSGDASASSVDIKKMKDELEFLKWALRSEVSSNHALTNNVNQLKQANATLTNQLKRN